MGNQTAYREGLAICQSEKHNITKIISAIIDDDSVILAIEKDVLKSFLMSCFYDEVQEDKKMALYRLAYDSAVSKKKEFFKQSLADEEESGLVNDSSISRYSNKSVLDATSPTRDIVMEPSVMAKTSGESETEEDFEDTLSDEMLLLHTEEEFEEKLQSLQMQEAESLSMNDDVENENSTVIIDRPLPKKSRKKTIITIMIFTILILIIAWLFIGLLINTGHGPQIDLGYSWFNQHIFHAFFLS